MSRVFFRTEAETAAPFWRLFRRDGITLGFTGHDRDLWFDGIRHRAAPGMLPSAVRRTAGLEPDSAEIEGALTHDSISAQDLANGRYDGARLELGLVDWETLDRATLFNGELGSVTREANGFTAELRSAKALLELDLVPYTSPTCRAGFCGPGCGLNAARFTHEARIAAIDLPANRITIAGGPAASSLLGGSLRWVDGPMAGREMQVADAEGTAITPDAELDPDLAPGTRLLLREGCDHTIATCQTRFANAANFRGEPFLPGNDLMVRYPAASA